MKRICVFLTTIALIAGMVGCAGESYALVISSTEGGNVTTPGEGIFIYDKGTVINLTAVAEGCYHFVAWTGNVSAITDVEAGVTNITMNDSYFIMANFAQDYSTQNTAICTASDEQSWEYPSYKHFVACSDSSGGAIITWQDRRNGTPNTDIYAQRVDSSGATQWTSNGVPICTANGSVRYPVITTDGSGGAIIAWVDYRSGESGDSYADIYAQRVDSSGLTQWTSNGVAICTAPDRQYNPTIVSDGSGGTIIGWEDSRNSSSTDYDIYAQRVDTDGNVKWVSGGLAICSNPSHQMVPIIVGDGSGGAIVIWRDSRSGGGDIYSQRINPLGIAQWASDGVAVTTTHSPGGEVGSTAVVADGSGGAIIAWDEQQEDIYAQQLDSSGIKQWNSNGLAICTSPDSQWGPTLVCDGSGGAIITWNDRRNGDGAESVYAQMVDGGGNITWTSNGVAICAIANAPGQPVVTSDGSGGGIITWADYRNGDYDIYAQRVDSSGATQWTWNGVPICTATGIQEYPVITSDGSGRAIIAWIDYRSANCDIYAQRVDADGCALAAGSYP